MYLCVPWIILESDDVKNIAMSFSFDCLCFHGPAEGLNVPPVRPKYGHFALFRTQEMPTKMSSWWAAHEQMITEMDSTRKSNRKRYAGCHKHSTHRGERARQSIAIFTLRAIWHILGRKSLIWVILTALVHKDEKIKSRTIFLKSKANVGERIAPVFSHWKMCFQLCGSRRSWGKSKYQKTRTSVRFRVLGE